MADVTLEFIAEQLRAIQDEQRSMREEMRSIRDDIGVLSGIVRRLDASVAELVQDFHAIRARLRILEQTP